MNSHVTSSQEVEAEAEEKRRLLVSWIDKCVWRRYVEESLLQNYLDETKAWVAESVKAIWKSESDKESSRTHSFQWFHQASYGYWLCPLHHSVRRNAECCARALLQHGWPANERCSYGETALHVACWSQNWQMVRLLLDNGADPNAANRYRRTPLMVAISRHENRCVNILAEEHVDVVAINGSRRCNATGFAAMNGNANAIRSLIANYSFDELFDGKNQPLLAASASSNYDSLKLLLNYAAEKNRLGFVNFPSETGKTPLMVVGKWCFSGHLRHKTRHHVDCLKLLLEHGADPNAACASNGYPAFYYAVKYKHCTEYCVLLMKRTNLDVLAGEVLDAMLYEMVDGARTDLLRLFTDRNLDVICAKDMRLVSRAISNPLLDPELIELLLEAGVDVVRGGGPTHYRFLDSSDVIHPSDVMLHVLELLLKAGATEALDGILQTHYDALYSRYEGFAESVAELLRKYTTQKHWNAAATSSLRFVKLGPRLPTLKNFCRSTLRSALLSTGRHPSVRKVDTRMLGLPKSLESYVTFTDED